LKQLHEELKELGFEGSYDRVAAFARVWRAGQTDRVNSASKRTPRIDCRGAVERAQQKHARKGNYWHLPPTLLRPQDKIGAGRLPSVLQY
ncbi:hypothetical protein, partial [Duganella levis]|uniref:hypothetical protein n=1 Tax=Duganella levis TaxID=2692169 RepID=UPI001E40D9C8